MYKLLPLCGDVGLGILSIVFVSIGFNRFEQTAFLLLPLAFLPDLDAIGEILRRGKLAAHAGNPHDHREFLHKPIVWLLGTGLLWFGVGYYGAIAFVMVFMHFLHDSFLTGWGIPWLWPVSKVRIKFFVDERNELSFAKTDLVRTWNSDELEKAIVAHGNENWIEDLYLRPTVVSVIEYGCFAISLALLWFLF